MDEVMYCEKCGFIGHILFSKQCKHCKTKMKILSEDMKYKYHIFVEDWVEIYKEEIAHRKDNFVTNELQSNPLFSIEEYNKQINKQIEVENEISEYQKKKQLEIQSKNLKTMNNNNCVPKCPTCGSTNIKKISTTNRIVSTGLFGLASSKIGKQWHCNNCNSDF